MSDYKAVFKGYRTFANNIAHKRLYLLRSECDSTFIPEHSSSCVVHFCSVLSLETLPTPGINFVPKNKQANKQTNKYSSAFSCFFKL